jgi:cobalt/nickel transport system permease protein
LLCTLIFIGVVTSYGRYEVVRLIPFMLYPAIVFSAAQLPARAFKSVWVVLPVILCIGLAGLFFDNSVVNVGGREFPGGAISLVSLLLKCVLTVTAALLMIATTGITKLSYAMRMLKLPRLLVLQFTLTYRYISVLSEEAAQMSLAYRLRACGRKGIQIREWGPLTGLLLLRTFERAQNVYRAMSLRGFDGDYHPGGTMRLGAKDAAYLLGWMLYFAAARAFDIPALLGSIV